MMGNFAPMLRSHWQRVLLSAPVGWPKATALLCSPLQLCACTLVVYIPFPLSEAAAVMPSCTPFVPLSHDE